MKNNLARLTIIALATLLTACGTFKKASTLPDQTPNGQTTSTTGTPADAYSAIISTLAPWQTLQTGGNITLTGSSSFSSSVQVRMIKDQAIFISLRPVLGIEVGRLLITADSLYAVDKVHKRYIAEKVSLLTSGIPVTVSDVQDIFLGRPFIIGEGTLDEASRTEVSVDTEGKGAVISPKEAYKGYSYAFAFDKSNRILTLNIMPQGSTTATYQVNYADVRSTQSGNIAHSIKVNANVDKRKLDLSLSYKNIEWNGNVKIDRSIPGGYSRMSASDLFSIFSN